MLFEIYKSSSQGNFYSISNESSKLLIECGVTQKELKKYLDFDFENVSACLLTHEHL